MLGVYSRASKRGGRSLVSLLTSFVLALGFLLFGGVPTLTAAYEVPTGTWSNPVNDTSSISFPSGLTATVTSSGRTDVTGVSTLGAKEWADGMYSPASMVTSDSGVAFLVNTGTCAASGTCTGLGTLTVTFNRPVRNPTFNFAGLGGTTGGYHWSALHAVLTSTTPGVTLNRASGNSQFAVTANRVTAVEDRTGAACVTVGNTGYTASCGGVQATGTSSTFSFDISAVFTPVGGIGSNSHDTGDEVILTVTVPQDFGDAPSSFDQTQAAAHVISGLYLGSGSTEDNANVRNATTSPNAGAGATGDSDDAFTSLPAVVAQTGATYSRTVPISGVTATSTVCGWLDFDRSGVFNTTALSGEQACATVAAGATSATLTWTVPSGASVGSTYARFRIGNTAAEITGKPTGLATTGEVEDYPVNIVAMPTITLRKTTTAGTGGAFDFTLTNTRQTTGTVTTTASDTPTQVDGDTATAGTQPFTAAAINTAVTIKESQLASGWAFSTASCTSGGTSVGTLSGTTMTLPAAAIVPGADIVCDYTNGQPAISLTKTAGSLSGLTAGSTLPYTFTVTNTGQTPLNSIAITDSKIATVTCDATALAIGAATTCTGTYTLKQSDVDAGQVVNNASVSGA
ncbi:MAG TPA: hypothetical protein DCM67_04425, partial [Propionibacteriaceae bacterium]|nr:hypothetical protein [Propionibacteriaceae bacterium]